MAQICEKYFTKLSGEVIEHLGREMRQNQLAELLRQHTADLQSMKPLNALEGLSEMFGKMQLQIAGEERERARKKQGELERKMREVMGQGGQEYDVINRYIEIGSI